MSGSNEGATIWVLRHAQAQAEGSCADIDRRLTSHGEQQASLLANSIATSAELSSLPAPNIGLISAARRTLRTAQLAFPELELRDERRAFYQAGVDDWVEALRSCGEDHVLVVGHNPTVADLVGWLSGDDTGAYPPCSLTVLGCNEPLAKLARGSCEVLERWRAPRG